MHPDSFASAASTSIVVLLWALLGLPFVAGAESGEARVRADLQRFLQQAAGDGSVELPPLSVFEIDRGRHPGPLRTRLSTESDRPFQGRVPVTVELLAGDQVVARHIVSPYVRVLQAAIVPARDLRRGETLGPGDVRVAKVDAARMRGDLVRTIDVVVGKRLKSSVREGQPLRESQIEVVPVVDRGDRVVLVLESGAIRIQAIGRAQESGGIGQWIRVLNVDSRREVSGRVAPDGNVHVAF
jgi:flagella basal body P-ring formation protein FlgA